jgi:hypothetical protein
LAVGVGGLQMKATQEVIWLDDVGRDQLALSVSRCCGIWARRAYGSRQVLPQSKRDDEIRAELFHR